MFTALDAMQRSITPYIYGPAMRNPLENILNQLHFDDICGDAGPEVHICATNVRSGNTRLYQCRDYAKGDHGQRVSADAVLSR